LFVSETALRCASTFFSFIECGWLIDLITHYLQSRLKCVVESAALLMTCIPELHSLYRRAVYHTE